MKATRLLTAALVLTVFSGTAQADRLNDVSLTAASDSALQEASAQRAKDRAAEEKARQEAIKDRFSDIKSDHWSYQAVKQLASEGLIDGAGTGYFNGDQPMTRYEMASIIARAMAKEKNANIEQKIVIEKLSEEYAKELREIGSQMKMLSEKVDRFQIHGYMGYRYDHQSGMSFLKPVMKNTIQLSVNATYRWDPHLDLIVQNVYNRSFISESSDYSNLGSLTWAEYKNRNLSAKFGRFAITPGYGLMFNDEKVQGLQLSYQLQKARGTLLWAKYKPITDEEEATSKQFVNNLTSHNNHPALTDEGLWALELDYAPDKETNFKAVYQTKPDTKNFVGEDGSLLYARWESEGTRFLELGFDRKIGHETTLTGVWSHSNASTQNNAYKAQIQFGDPWPPLKGKKAVTLAYYNAPANAMIIGGSGGLIGDYISLMGEGFKGPLLGFQWSPVDYQIFDIFFMPGKTASDASPFGTLLPKGSNKKILRVEYTVLF